MPSPRTVIITPVLLPDLSVVAGIDLFPFAVSINRRRTSGFIDRVLMGHAAGVVESERDKGHGRECYLSRFHRFNLLAYNQNLRATSCKGGFPRPNLSAFDRREKIKATGGGTYNKSAAMAQHNEKAATGSCPSPLRL